MYGCIDERETFIVNTIDPAISSKMCDLEISEIFPILYFSTHWQ